MIKTTDNALAGWFWTYFHRSDESASWRWLVTLAFAVGAMPVFGSALSVLLVGMAIVAVAYLIFGRFGWIARERGIGWILTAYVLIALVFSLIGGKAFDGFDAMAANFGLLFCLPLLPVLRVYYRDYWDNWLRRGISVGSIVAGGWVLVSILLAGPARQEAFAGNPLVFAYLTGSALLLLLPIFASAKGLDRWLAAAGIAGAAGALVASGGRAAMIAAIALVLAFIVTRFRRLNPRDGLLLAYIVLLSVCSFVAFFGKSAIVVKFVSRFERLISFGPLGEGDVSVDVRWQMYRGGLEAFLNSPFLGYGRQNVMSAASSFAGVSEPFAFSHLHNAYLTEAVASGILGPITLILALITPLLASRGKGDPWRSAAFLFVAYTALCFATNIGFYHDLTVFYFGGILVMFNCLPFPPRPGAVEIEAQRFFEEWQSKER